MNPAQVAMHRLGRMQEVAPRAGGSQRGHDFLADQPRLADAGNDHAAAAVEEAIGCPAESRSIRRADLGDRAAFASITCRAMRSCSKAVQRRGRTGWRQIGCSWFVVLDGVSDCNLD